jgi:hypothetical protein
MLATNKHQAMETTFKMEGKEDFRIITLKEGLYKIWYPTLQVLLRDKGHRKWLDHDITPLALQQQQQLQRQQERPQQQQQEPGQQLQQGQEEQPGQQEHRGHQRQAMPVGPVTWRQLLHQRFLSGKMDLYEYAEQMEHESKAGTQEID